MTLVAAPEAVTTWMASAKYGFTPDVMLYGRVATGAQPGSPNGNTPGIPPTVKAENLTNYEVGLKAEFPEHGDLVDLALFYIDWKDVQISVSNGTTGFLAKGFWRMRGMLPPRVSNSPVPTRRCRDSRLGIMRLTRNASSSV